MATPFTVRNRISRRIGRPSSSVIKFKRIIKISKSQLNWLAVASSHHPQPGEHRNPYLNVLLCLEAKGCLRTLSHTRSFTVTSTRREPTAGAMTFYTDLHLHCVARRSARRRQSWRALRGARRGARPADAQTRRPPWRCGVARRLARRPARRRLACPRGGA
jgi:hypothetical protein